jgi:hypothetical protein
LLKNFETANFDSTKISMTEFDNTKISNTLPRSTDSIEHGTNIPFAVQSFVTPLLCFSGANLARIWSNKFRHCRDPTVLRMQFRFNSEFHKLEDLQKKQSFLFGTGCRCRMPILPKVARWFVFEPKIQIWVYFGGSSK